MHRLRMAVVCRIPFVVVILLASGTGLHGLGGCGSSGTGSPVDAQAVDAQPETSEADGDAGGDAATVDCPATCAHVAAVCEGQSNIDATWLDVCRSACMDRLQIIPDSALREQTCVFAATDCTTAVLCVS